MSDRPPDSSPGHLTEDEVEGYATGALPPASVIAVAGHIAGCPACSRKLEAVLPLVEATQQMMHSIFSSSLLPQEHLDDESLSAYAANKVDAVERELIEEHLAECESCRMEVVEVRTLLTLADDIPLGVQRPESSSFGWQTVLRWFGPFPVRQALQVATLALAVGLVVFLMDRKLLDHKTLRPATVPTSTQREQALDARQAALERQERAAEGQTALLKQREQKVADAQQKVESDRKHLDGEAARLASSVLAMKKSKTDGINHAGSRPSSLPDPRQLAFNPLGDGGVSVTTLAGDGSGADPLPFALQAPLPGSTVLSERVVFLWSAVRQGTEPDGELARCYRVELTGPGGKTQESPLLKFPWWKPASGDHLLPGHVYSWKVFAYSDVQGHDPIAQSPQGPLSIEFRTAALDKRDLQAAQASSLRLGIALARAGLLDEASGILKSCLLASPHDKAALAWLQRVHTLQAERARQAEKRLEKFPASTGAAEMRAALAARIREK